MTAIPPIATQGYGKAIIQGIVQPFAAALSAVIAYFIEQHIGHPLPGAISSAMGVLIDTPLTVLAIIYTPHNLFGGN